MGGASEENGQVTPLWRGPETGASEKPLTQGSLSSKQFRYQAAEPWQYVLACQGRRLVKNAALVRAAAGTATAADVKISVNAPD